MFKWFRNKILKGIVKDLMAEMPYVKEKALKYIEEYKDEVLAHVKEAIKKCICELVERKEA